MNTPRFKVGDRVEVVAGIDDQFDEMCVGRTGTVTDVDDVDWDGAEIGYTVDFDINKESPPHDFFWGSELKLINP